MARYFFDVLNGGLAIDDEGIECLDAQSASREALHALPDLAKSYSVGEAIEQITVIMRDGLGRAIFRATLTIDAEWLDRAAPT